MEGGHGSDVLQGVGGDDRYLFHPGESGCDRIVDSAGTNLAEIQGYAGQRVAAFMVGKDMW